MEDKQLDRLAQMFEMQKGLNMRVGVPHDREMTEDEKNYWILQYCRCMSQEIAELTDCVDWKHWHTLKVPTDWHNAKIEIIDLLHFLLSLALVSGMTADDFFGVYKQKMAVNHARQDNGYTKDTKTEDDNRSIIT